MGIALIVLACVAAAKAGVTAHGVIDGLRAAPPLRLAALLALVAATPLLSGVMFYLLTRRCGVVGIGEMCWLITSAWLLNFLPLNPGMFGRIAYHRAVNHIPIRASATTIIWATVLSVIAAAILLVLVVLGELLLHFNVGAQVALTASGVVPIALLAWHARRARPKPDPEVWRLVAALAVRYVELHLWGARLWLAFDLVGKPIAFSGALVLAAAATVVSLFPLAPNGLGVREWVVGLLAPLLPIAMVGGAAMSTAAGLEADLLHRAAEIIVAIPMGLVASMWVAGRVRKVKPA